MRALFKNTHTIVAEKQRVCEYLGVNNNKDGNGVVFCFRGRMLVQEILDEVLRGNTEQLRELVLLFLEQLEAFETRLLQMP